MTPTPLETAQRRAENAQRAVTQCKILRAMSAIERQRTGYDRPTATMQKRFEERLAKAIEVLDAARLADKSEPETRVRTIKPTT